MENPDNLSNSLAVVLLNKQLNKRNKAIEEIENVFSSALGIHPVLLRNLNFSDLSKLISVNSSNSDELKFFAAKMLHEYANLIEASKKAKLSFLWTSLKIYFNVFKTSHKVSKDFIIHEVFEIMKIINPLKLPNDLKIEFVEVIDSNEKYSIIKILLFNQLLFNNKHGYHYQNQTKRLLLK